MTDMQPIGIETRLRIRDNVFSLEACEEEGMMDFLMEERDWDARKDEEYVADHCLAMLDLDELEYLAKRILDAVAYERQRLDNMTPQPMPR